MVPKPTPPVSAPTEPGKEAPAPPTPPTQRWEYELAFAGGYDTNVEFVPEGSGDVLLMPRGELARVFRSPRGQFRVGAFSRAFVYAAQENASRVDGSASLAGSRALTPSVTLAGDLSAGLEHTDSSNLLNSQGVLLPPTRARILRGSARVDWLLGARSSLRVDGRVYTSDFEDPRLVDSSSARGSLDVSRRMSERGSLHAAYSIERAGLETASWTHFGSLQWDQVLSARSALLIEGGSSYTDGAVALGLASAWNFYGGVSFTRELGRSRVVLFARREVIPVFGIGGLQLSDRFGMEAAVPLGKYWELGLYANLIRRQVPEDSQGDAATSGEATASLRRSLGRRFFVGAEGRYRRRGPTGTFPEVEGLQAGLAVTFASPRPGGGQ